MMSFRDVIPSCKYDENNQVEFSHQRNHRNKNEISSRTHLQAVIKAVRFLTSCSNYSDVMTSRYDIKTSMHVHTLSLMLFLEPINRKYLQKYMCIIIIEHRQADIGEMSFVTSWRHVMTPWHHANTKTDNIFGLSEPGNYRNNKNHFPSFSTSWDSSSSSSIEHL